jgi:outer membrane receptor for ferrienterochelin and colicins
MQKRIWTVFTLLCLVVIAQAGNVVLTGRVIEKSSQHVMPGAHVYLKGTNVGTATNNKGVYRLSNLAPGTYQLIVSFSGFHRVIQEIEITEGVNQFDCQLEESKSHLGEVVVTGTGTAHHLKNAPVPTELITSKTIAKTGAIDFSDLMTSISPSFDFSPNSMGSGMKLNGLGNEHTLILINGKRIYGDVGDMNDLNRINPDNIERIEVVKGASSLLYGSDAIAGVINIITKESKQHVNFNSTSRLRKHNTWQQSNTLDLNAGKLSSSTSFGAKGSDGWQLSPIDEKGKETFAKAMNEYHDFTVGQNFSYKINDRLEAYAEGSYYEKEVDRNKSHDYGFYYKDVTLAGGIKYLLKNHDYLSLDVHNDRYQYYYRYYVDGNSYNANDLVENKDQRLNNWRLKYVNTLSEEHKLTLGADYQKEKMISNRVENGEADANTLGIYAQDEWNVLPNMDVVAGMRYVKHKEFGSAFTPKISLLYKLNPINLRATYGKGFKTPTIRELYYDYEKNSRGKQYIYKGNRELDPQRSNYYSLGVDFQKGFFSLNVSAYINEVDNLIENTPIDPLPGDKEAKIYRRQYLNIDEAVTKGVDVLVNSKLGFGFTLGGGYSYVDARDETADLWLEGVAHHYGNVNLSYDRKWNSYAFNASILGRLQDGKVYYDRNGNREDAKGYELWKLTTNHRFTNLGACIVEASLGVDNLFDYVDDRPYGSNYGTLSPGRTFFVGLKFNLSK